MIVGIMRIGVRIRTLSQAELGETQMLEMLVQVSRWGVRRWVVRSGGDVEHGIIGYGEDRKGMR